MNINQNSCSIRTSNTYYSCRFASFVFLSMSVRLNCRLAKVLHTIASREGFYIRWKRERLSWTWLLIFFFFFVITDSINLFQYIKRLRLIQGQSSHLYNLYISDDVVSFCKWSETYILRRNRFFFHLFWFSFCKFCVQKLQ